jgi:hypothetical protein
MLKRIGRANAVLEAVFGPPSFRREQRAVNAALLAAVFFLYSGSFHPGALSGAFMALSGAFGLIALGYGIVEAMGSLERLLAALREEKGPRV